jgi:hypothetical protein
MSLKLSNYLFVLMLFLKIDLHSQDCDIIYKILGESEPRKFVLINSVGYLKLFTEGYEVRENLQSIFDSIEIDSIMKIAESFKSKKAYWKTCNSTKINFVNSKTELKLLKYNNERGKDYYLKHQNSLYRLVYLTQAIYYKNYAIIQYNTKQRYTTEYLNIYLLQNENGKWKIIKLLYAGVS